MDPNSPSAFEQEQNGLWLKETWDAHIRKKCKQALDKWNKDTGGGDGNPTEFVNFCGADPWLVWTFCLDIGSNFLLANNAGGRMPRHLQIEAGFEEDVSSVTDDQNTGSSGEKRIAELELEVEQSKKQQQKFDQCLGLVKSHFNKKEEKESNTHPCIEKVTAYSKMMLDSEVLETMSPSSKEVCLDAIKTQRSKTLEKLKDDH